MNKIIPISESTIFKSLKINAEVDKKNLLNGGPVDMNKLFVIHNQPSQRIINCSKWSFFNIKH